MLDIYIGHSTDMDFEKLYEAVENSSLADKHSIVFPHDDGEELFDSKGFFRDNCDLFVADVSHASTGLGIELGWADMMDVPILCICHRDSDPSSALFTVCDSMHEYSEFSEIPEIISEELD